jgi:transposase
LLLKIAALGLAVPVTLVLDNARYQRSATVRGLAAKLQIGLLFFPAYSPNVNLIERFWLFAKKKVLYSKYYSTYSAFKDAIAATIGQMHTCYKTELDSLLTFTFQSFQHSQTVNV